MNTFLFNKIKQIKLSKKQKIILILFAMIFLLTAISLATFLAGAFNRRLEVQLLTSDEVIDTGKVHNVLIRNSYSNPNDEKSEKIRIYLRTADDKPNTIAKLLNVNDGKLEYVCKNNDDLTVTVNFVEEKDEQGNITDSYLEYILPPGSSVDMELEFVVEAGYTGLEETLKLVPQVIESEIVANDKIAEPAVIKWKSKFPWENFNKRANTTSIEYNKTTISEDKVNYTFSVDNKMTKKEGSVYTKKVEIEDTLTFPEAIKLSEDIEVSGDKNNELINDAGEVIYKVDVTNYDYKIKYLKVDKNDDGLSLIKYKLEILNDNEEDYKFNPVGNIITTLNLNKIEIDFTKLENAKIENTADLIITSVNKVGTEIPIDIYKDRSSEIINFYKAGEISISKRLDGIYRPADAKATDYVRNYTNIVRPKYKVNYKITIYNGMEIKENNVEIEDILPAVLTLEGDPILVSSREGTLNKDIDYTYTKENLEDGTNKLKFKINEVSANSNITISYTTIINAEHYVPGEKIENIAKMDDKEVTTPIYADSKNEATFEKQIVSRTLKTSTGSPVKIYRNIDYDYLYAEGDLYGYFGIGYPTQEELSDALLEFGPGDKIEYLLTFDNQTSEKYYGTIYDYQPFTFKGSGYDSSVTEAIRKNPAITAQTSGIKYYVSGNDSYSYTEGNGRYEVGNDSVKVNGIFDNTGYNFSDFMDNAIPGETGERCEPILNANQAQWTFLNNVGEEETDENKEKYNKYLDAYTTYRQTVVVEIPGDNSYSSDSEVNKPFQDLVTAYSYYSNYGESKPLNTVAEFVEKENKENMVSKIYNHYPEQQIYLNTGILAKSELKDGEISIYFTKNSGGTINSSDYKENVRVFEANDGEALVNYIYLFNDSQEEMKISDYEINLNIPKGFNYLGLVSELGTISDSHGASRIYGNIDSSKVQEYYYTSYSLWVSNKRSKSPSIYYENLPNNYNQLTDDRRNSNLLIYESTKNSSNNGTSIRIDSAGSIKPYSGIVLMYAVSVDSDTAKRVYEGEGGASFTTTIRRIYNSKYNRYTNPYMKQITPVIKAGDYFADHPRARYRQFVNNDGNSLGYRNYSTYMSRYTDSAFNTNPGNPYYAFSYVTIQLQSRKTSVNVTKEVVKNNDKDLSFKDNDEHNIIEGEVTYKINILNTGANDSSAYNYHKNISNIYWVPLGPVNEYLPVNYQTLVDTIDSPYILKEIYLPKLCYYKSYGENWAYDHQKIITDGYFKLPTSDPRDKNAMIDAGWKYNESLDCFVYETGLDGQDSQDYYIRVTVKNIEGKTNATGTSVENGKNTSAYQYIIEFVNKNGDYEPLLATQDITDESVDNSLDIYLTFLVDESIQRSYNSFALVASEDNIDSEIITTSEKLKAKETHREAGVIGEDNPIISAYKKGPSDTSLIDYGYGSIGGNRIIVQDNEWVQTKYTEEDKIMTVTSEDGEEIITSDLIGSVLKGSKFHGKLTVKSALTDESDYESISDLIIYDLYGLDDIDTIYNVDFSSIKVTDSNGKTFEFGKDYEIYYTKTNFLIDETETLIPGIKYRYSPDWDKIDSMVNAWTKYEPSEDESSQIISGAKGFKVVFNKDCGIMYNGYLLNDSNYMNYNIFVEYDGIITGDTTSEIYPNVLAYEGNINGKGIIPGKIREDISTAIVMKDNEDDEDDEDEPEPEPDPEIYRDFILEKNVVDGNNDIINPNEEYEFLIIRSNTSSNTLNVSNIFGISKVKIKAGESVDFAENENVEIIYNNYNGENNTKDFFNSTSDFYYVLEIPKEGYNTQKLSIGTYSNTISYISTTKTINLNGIPGFENNDDFNYKSFKVVRFRMYDIYEASININCENSYKTDLFLKKINEQDEIIKNKVTFNLYDEEGNIIKLEKNGATYNYDLNESNDSTGNIEFSGTTHIYNLPYGKYTLREKYAPVGYSESKDIEISIEKEDNNITLEKSIENNKDPQNENVNIIINKINSQTKDKITSYNATFEVYRNEEGSEPIEFVKDREGVYSYDENTPYTADIVNEITTEYGEIEIYNLPAGIYYLKETKTPKGYYEDDELIKIEIRNGEDDKIIDIENIPVGKLKIIKRDDNYNYLENVKFEIVDTFGNEIEFIKDIDGNYSWDKNGEVHELITNSNGIINISNLPLGTYTLKEIEPLDTYGACQDKQIILSASNMYNTKTETIVNYHNIGHIKIQKKDINGSVIDSDQTGFKVYDENNNVVRFEDNKKTGNNGREYTYNDEGEYTTILTDGGYIYLKDLPLGTYYIEEVIAPQGYTLSTEKKQVVVTYSNYNSAKLVSFQNAEYEFGSEEYVSTSYQMINEVDDEINCGYSYYGKEEDYKDGNKNYIVVDDKEDLIRYTLKVANMSQKNFEQIVLINKLPEINDVGVVNQDEPRDSEFTIKLHENPNFEVNIYDRNGQIETIPKDYYRIEYSNETIFTDSDWEGDLDSERWLQEKSENTKSFRIVFTDNFTLPSKCVLEIKFDGDIQDDSSAGEIAWNSFGYRYYVGNRALTPEPPKVGVKIPYIPTITKKVTEGLSGRFTFEIVDAETENIIDTFEIETGETKELPIKRTINGIENGIIESGKKYIIREKENVLSEIAKIDGIGGEIEKDSFILTYNPEIETKMTFINAPLSNASININKTDIESGANLDGVKFELKDENGNLIRVELVNGEYIPSEFGEDTITTVDGKATIAKLPFGTYTIREIETKDGYILRDTEEYIVEISEEDYREIDGEIVNVPEELNIKNEKNRVVIDKLWEDVLLKDAELSIINKDTNETITTFVTNDEEYIYRGLPAGNYILRELTAPKGFIKSEDISFRIDEYGKCYIGDEEVEKIEMYDDLIYGSIKVVKKAEILTSGKGDHVYKYEKGNLQGVTFELYAKEDIVISGKLLYEKDECISRKVTDENGQIIFNDLPFGKYYIKETNAPAGYVVSKELQNFDIYYNDEEIYDHTVEIVNKRKVADINITKYEKGSKDRLEGAIFGLYAEDGTLLETVITDKEGKAHFTIDIPVGDYTIKELDAPDGYVKSKDTIKIEFGDKYKFDLVVYNSKEKTDTDIEIPYTGDNIPIIACSIIGIVVLANVVIRYIEVKKNKKAKK